MTMPEGLTGFPASRAGTAGRPSRDKAYFLNLLGDGHNGLGHAEAAIEAYRQAAEEFRAQGAQCSYALCLFKIADGHMSLGEPWHALGYLEACLPLLRDLGLTRHETLAQNQLDACQAELAGVRLLGEGRARPAACAGAQPSRPRDPARRSAKDPARRSPGRQARRSPGRQARRNTVALSARQG